MRTYSFFTPIFILMVLMIVQSCAPVKEINFYPIRVKGQAAQGDNISFKPHELIVMFKNRPTDLQRATISAAINSAGIRIDAMQRCNGCDSYVELWRGRNIHSVIRTEGVSGGSGGGGTRGVGEDTLARYSLNYISRMPVDTSLALLSFVNANYAPEQKNAVSGAGKDTIIIAVLDTGIDTANFINSKYLWTNRSETPGSGDGDGNCYAGDVNGWNFIDNNTNIRDDNPSVHGTLISNYIIDEFTSSARNFVQIMSLKTHDRNGYGDLFSSVCAIHYAAEKNVNIINASWGFYYYHDGPHPYLDTLITKIIRQKGILFITAAGNKIPEEDELARRIYYDSFRVRLPDAALRNLNVHNFFPACLSDSVNNVITITTTDGAVVSPTQNYSSRFVDLGVKADQVSAGQMKFLEPFTRVPQFISGSSFATAIVTGKLGAYMPKTMYRPGLSKTDVIPGLISLMRAGNIPVFIFDASVLERNELIRKGRYSKRR